MWSPRALRLTLTPVGACCSSRRRKRGYAAACAPTTSMASGGELGRASRKAVSSAADFLASQGHMPGPLSRHSTASAVRATSCQQARSAPDSKLQVTAGCAGTHHCERRSWRRSCSWRRFGSRGGLRHGCRRLHSRQAGPIAQALGWGAACAYGCRRREGGACFLRRTSWPRRALILLLCRSPRPQRRLTRQHRDPLLRPAQRRPNG